TRRIAGGALYGSIRSWRRNNRDRGIAFGSKRAEEFAPAMNIRIVLADDHRIVREGFRALLDAQKDFEVVGETGDGLEAIRLVDKLKPDVLLVDMMMPGMNGLEVTRQITQRGLPAKVVILSMHSNEAYVLEAMKNGAAAYVLKDATSTELIRAVREAVAGRRYLSPPLSERAIEVYL